MYYTEDISDIAENGVSDLEGQRRVDDPAGYRPDPGLVDAVNVALVLNRPLLLTGQPGTGKTQLAHSVAWQLKSRKQLNVTSARVEKFETKSSSTAKDLFYTFDTLRRFHAAHSGGSMKNADYISYNALGRALLNALPPDQISDLLPKDILLTAQVRSIVLIDEIDKAPRDFPNDLLNEIDQMYFKIPELDNVVVGGPGRILEEYKPIVFITSNSERNLPDPFLRRCIFYDIPFPTKDRLELILLTRLGHLNVTGGQLIEEALAFFLMLRENNVIKRKISPAELIQWLTFMLRNGAKPSQSLKEARDHALKGLSALTKDPADQEGVRQELAKAL